MDLPASLFSASSSDSEDVLDPVFATAIASTSDTSECSPTSARAAEPSAENREERAPMRSTVESLLGKPLFDDEQESDGELPTRSTVESLLGKPLFDDGDDSEVSRVPPPQPHPQLQPSVAPAGPSPAAGECECLDLLARFPNGMSNLLRFSALFGEETMARLRSLADAHGKNGWMKIDELSTMMQTAPHRAVRAPAAWWAQQLRICGLSVPDGAYNGEWFGFPQLGHFVALQKARKGHRRAATAPARSSTPSDAASPAPAGSRASAGSLAASPPRRVRAATPASPASLQHLLATEGEIAHLRHALAGDARCRADGIRCASALGAAALCTLLVGANALIFLWQWRALAFEAEPPLSATLGAGRNNTSGATAMGPLPRALGHLASFNGAAWLAAALLGDATAPLAQAVCCGGAAGRAPRAARATLGVVALSCTAAHLIVWLAQNGDLGGGAAAVLSRAPVRSG